METVSQVVIQIASAPGAAEDQTNRLTPHPGPLPVEGRGSTSALVPAVAGARSGLVHGRPITSIIELRNLLAERFPNLRLGSAPTACKSAAVWPTGLPQIDRLLGGGLPKSAMTELVSAQLSSGSALVLLALLRQARRANQWVALVDAQDSFDPSKLGEAVFSRLVWVRCREAAQALKATDLLLRDGNLPLVLLDLQMNPAAQLRKIPATTWHRWQRLLEPISTALLVLTPYRMVSGARGRLELKGRFPLNAVTQSEDELLPQLRSKLTDTKQHQGTNLPTEVGVPRCIPERRIYPAAAAIAKDG